MKLKTAYRPKKPEAQPQSELPVDIPPVEESAAQNIPTVEIDGKEPESIAAVTVDIPAGEKIDPEAVEQALQEAVVADEAAQALRQQIAAVHQAERQAKLATVDPRTLPLEDRIALWQQHGLSVQEAQFVREHPEIADHPQVSNHAAALALREGFERDSPEYFERVLETFQAHMRGMQRQAAATALEFFRPKPPRQAPPRTAAAIVSAPVSRDVPDGIPRELKPNQVRLSPEEIEAARLSGISTVEYARHKLRLLQEKASGQRQ
jgi:hypothetical protein